MGAVTAVSRAFGFVRVLVVAAVLGTTFLGNAFQAANSVSNVVFELVAAGALVGGAGADVRPAARKGDDAEADRLASGLLGIAARRRSGVVTVVGIVAAPLLARLLTIGVAERRGRRRAARARDVPPALVPAADRALRAGARSRPRVLYARRRFAITAAAPIGNTVVMVAALVVFRVVAGPDPTLRLSRHASECSS